MRQVKYKRPIIRIESLLNKTPHYGLVLLIGIILVMILSFIMSKTTGEFVYQSIDPVSLEKTQNVFVIENFLSFDNFLGFINNGLVIFSGMSSTVIILVTIIAFGVSEKSGFLYTVFKKLLFNVPKSIVTVALVTLGVLSNVSSTGILNAGYIVLLPLGAFIYMGNGRNPLAGIAAVFAATFGGYSINVLLTSHTLVLNNITESVASEVLNNYAVLGDSNRTLMFALIVVVVLTISWLTEKYIVNILPIYDLEVYTYHRITTNEKRGLIAALILTFIMALIYIYLLLPPSLIDLPGSGKLLGDYDIVTTSYVTQLINSPFTEYFVIHISYYLILAGFVYGIFSHKFKSLNDMIKSSIVSVADHAEYFVLAFILSQFIYVLYQTNISLYFLLKLTNLVQDSSVLVMVISLVIVTAIINLFVPSSSTKWSIMAPIIIPLFVSASVNPVLAQSAFQVGDSVTNTLTAVMPYTIFAYTLFNIYAKKTKQHCGNGTYFKLTVPYSGALIVTTTLTILVWVLLNIDLGSGVSIYI